MEIRYGKLSDLRELSIINSLGSEEGRKKAQERLPEFIDAENLIVATKEGEILGLLYWKREFFSTDNWWLTQITVNEAHRRQGVAKALIEHFFSIARSKGVKDVYVDVSASNEASINMMKKLNAIQVGNLEVSGDTTFFWKFYL